jgi:hypothetical protein
MQTKPINPWDDQDHFERPRESRKLQPLKEWSHEQITKISPEVRERVVRMVQEHREKYPSLWAALESL